MSWFSKGTFVKGRGEGHSGMFIVCTMYVPLEGRVEGQSGLLIYEF